MRQARYSHSNLFADNVFFNASATALRLEGSSLGTTRVLRNLIVQVNDSDGAHNGILVGSGMCKGTPAQTLARSTRIHTYQVNASIGAHNEISLGSGMPIKYTLALARTHHTLSLALTHTPTRTNRQRQYKDCPAHAHAHARSRLCTHITVRSMMTYALFNVRYTRVCMHLLLTKGFFSFSSQRI